MHSMKNALCALKYPQLRHLQCRPFLTTTIAAAIPPHPDRSSTNSFKSTTSNTPRSGQNIEIAGTASSIPGLRPER